jgi:hypothetical protein
MQKWVDATYAKVAAMQFDSVTEVPRQFGVSDVSADDVALPFTQHMQDISKFDGQPEGDLDQTIRPYIPVRDMPTDRHLQRKPVGDPTPDVNWPLTAATLSRLPEYRRRLPTQPVQHDAREPGECECVLNEDPAVEARRWVGELAKDTRDCATWTMLHKCGPSCYKYGKTCRHYFLHLVQLVMEDKRTLKQLRRGKLLVEDIQVVEDESGGRRGRILVRRDHPFMGSTNPIGLVSIRSNLDVQAMHRVPAPGLDDDCDLGELCMETFRACHDQGFYTGDYSTKLGPGLEPILEKQRQGIEKLQQELEDKGLPKDEVAYRTLVRLQTSENRRRTRAVSPLPGCSCTRTRAGSPTRRGPCSSGTWCTPRRGLTTRSTSGGVRERKRMRGCWTTPRSTSPATLTTASESVRRRRVPTVRGQREPAGSQKRAGRPQAPDDTGFFV